MRACTSVRFPSEIIRGRAVSLRTRRESGRKRQHSLLFGRDASQLHTACARYAKTPTPPGDTPVAEPEGGQKTLLAGDGSDFTPRAGDGLFVYVLTTDVYLE